MRHAGDRSSSIRTVAVRTVVELSPHNPWWEPLWGTKISQGPNQKAKLVSMFLRVRSICKTVAKA